MLSYQHIFHAGNLADVQKHALLAWMLAHLTRKDKPLSYLETHAGRALYDLATPEAVKTREAASGIEAVADWFADDHPYAKVVASMRLRHGDAAYAGSPLLAAEMLRACDTLHAGRAAPARKRRPARGHADAAKGPGRAHLSAGWI
jgi:23S rRNA (adenine2030-N6)-methyltransferase